MKGKKVRTAKKRTDRVTTKTATMMEAATGQRNGVKTKEWRLETKEKSRGTM